MKISMKRIAALVMALIMVVGLLPVVNNSVNAADPEPVYGLTDTGIGLGAGKAANWTAAENTLTGSVTGVNRVGKVHLAASDTLTITNKKNAAATLSFDFAISGVFTVASTVTIDGTAYGAETTGSFSKELASGASISIVMDAKQNRNGANTISIAITKLSLVSAASGPVTTTFEAPANGSYTVAYAGGSHTINAGSASVPVENEATVEYTLTANPGTGYKLVGWFNVTTGSYLSTSQTYEGCFDTASTIKAVIVPEASAVFVAGNNYYANLNDAVAYAITYSAANPEAKDRNQVSLFQSGTLEAVEGGYTIPAGITLLIPMDDLYTVTPISTEISAEGRIAPESTTDATTPKAYKTLTLAEGATLIVNGTVDVEAKHTALQGGTGKRENGGRVCGDYGAIYMSPNSNITLNSGALLYAWGFVYGEGTITANSGSKVYEIMQVNDFPGGNNLAGFVDKDLNHDAGTDGITDNDYLKTFPFSQYYVQNIEVALTLNYGATEYIYTTLYAANMFVGTDVEFIGGNGMFIPKNGSITKDYDPSTDRLVVNVNGDATVSSIVLDMSGTDYAALMQQFIGSDKFDSSRYILSLNSNITININSGTATIGQDVSLLPGVEIYVGRNATLEIAEQVIPEGELNNLTVYGSGGHNVYVWDLENWGPFVFDHKQLVAASYSPTTGRYKRVVADLKDALVDVNGTVICNGFIYSTVTIDDKYIPISGGAAIISSAKTGKIVLQAGAGEEEMMFCLDGSSAVDAHMTIDSAWLKNGDGSFVHTRGAEAGTTYNYCARHDKWYTGECIDCATPDYVEITFIVNGVGGPAETEVGTLPVYPGGTPTKAADGCTVYTFAGWSTSANGAVLSELPLATEDAVYYAIFTSGISHTGEVKYSDNGNGTHNGAYECCGTPVVTGETCKTDAEFVCQDGNCQKCGAEMAATEDHGSDYYCDKNCNICGEEIWPTIDHEREYDCDSLCQHCGQEIWPDAACVSDADYPCQDGKCVFCGEDVAATEEHDWLDADCETAATCNDCGATSGGVLGHGHTLGWGYDEYEDYHDVKCLDCEAYSYEEPHDYDDTTKLCDCGRVKRYTVIFMNGDTEFERAFCLHSGTLNNYGMPIPEVPEGHSWGGWYTEDGTRIMPGMSLTEDVVAYATFKLNSYELTVEMWDGTEVKLNVPYGTKLADLAEVQAIKDVVYIEGDEYKTNGKLYGKFELSYFSVGGAYAAAIVDQTMPAKDLLIKGVYNYTGWFQPNGINWTYVVEWVEVESGWMQINEADYSENGTGSDWYYFEPTGEDFSYMVTGISRVPYPTVAINGITYGPNAEDLAGADKYGYTDATTSLFVFGADGKFDQSTGAIYNEDNSVVLHYAVNGQLPWHLGFVAVGSHLYYFVGANEKAVGDVYVSRGYNAAGFALNGVYTFGADGNMCRYKGITEMADGTLRYYENYQLMLGKGLINVDGDYYYIKSNGTLVVGTKYWVAKTNGYDVAVGEYEFEDNGVMIIPVADPVKNGFYYENGNWFYYDNGEKGYCAGLICTTGMMWYETADAEGVEIQGWVYVKSNAALVTGEYYVTNVNGHDTIESGDLCVFGDDCLLQEAKNGVVDGFYYEDNQIAYAAGLVKIDDSYYYVKSNGQIVTDGYYWITNVNDTGVKAGKYLFDEDGKMLLGFTGVKDGYYYVDGGVAYAAGLVEIEEGKYIYVRSSGELATGMYWTTNHNGVLAEGYYDFGEDGILVIE